MQTLLPQQFCTIPLIFTFVDSTYKWNYVVFVLFLFIALFIEKILYSLVCYWHFCRSGYRGMDWLLDSLFHNLFHPYNLFDTLFLCMIFCIILIVTSYWKYKIQESIDIYLKSLSIIHSFVTAHIWFSFWSSVLSYDSGDFFLTITVSIKYINNIT